MAVITEPAPAKLNLTLGITGRRADGYHELDSLVVFTAWGDRLTFDDAAGLELELSGPRAGELAGESDNLVLRAARRLAERAGRPALARITLDKHIPVAAGLGGGSSDAAATLTGLARLWRLDLDPAALSALALELGADLPVCLYRRPARMTGIGGHLEPLAGMPGLPVLLVHPGEALSTRSVFEALGVPRSSGSGADRPGNARPGAALGAGSGSPVDRADRRQVPGEPGALLAWLGSQANDLEAPARRLRPVIDEVLAALARQPGCRLARMSGSGATCFGLFDDPQALVAAEQVLAAGHPEWWVQPTRTLGS